MAEPAYPAGGRRVWSVTRTRRVTDCKGDDHVRHCSGATRARPGHGRGVAHGHQRRRRRSDGARRELLAGPSVLDHSAGQRQGVGGRARLHRPAPGQRSGNCRVLAHDHGPAGHVSPRCDRRRLRARGADVDSRHGDRLRRSLCLLSRRRRRRGRRRDAGLSAHVGLVPARRWLRDPISCQENVSHSLALPSGPWRARS